MFSWNMGRKSVKSRNRKGSSRYSSKVAPMPLQPMKCCHRIAPKERLFLEAAERGDKHSMIRCLQPPAPVNVNCTNMLGRSAIQIAVDNENIEIVEMLLKQEGVKIGDALLYAIREGVFKIVEMLIDHPSITPEMLGTEWYNSIYIGNIDNLEESNDYSPDISPVILAAHCNQFEILQLLLMRGAIIERPHELSCSCRKCQEMVHEDGLRHSLRRINTYRALASPAWISLTCSDPILSAFKLSWELEKLALRENEFKDAYIALSNQCKRCACDLLDQCRSTEEVIAVLNKRSDNDSDDEGSDGEEKVTLSRLKLAIKYEQKEFVAHPNCQQLLTSIWYEGLPGWRKRHTVAKIVVCLGLVFMMPFMALYYWIFPFSKIGKLLRSPFMKFLYHSASFVTFLVLLMWASTQMSGLKDREKLRGPPPTTLEWLICIWVTGFVWSECKQLWEEGLKAYIRQWWNWMDFIMLSLYLTTFTLRLVAYFQVESGKYGPKEMERKDWPFYDPTMVSEGLFAVANVFSFARLIFLFQADQYLGPLQISLGCMLIDIAKFMLIFFLVLTSFACGLNQLYWYYTPTEEGNPPSFYTLENSYRTLYWSLFSLTQLKDIKIKNSQYFTEMVGEMLFMVYHTMAVIVLINMLIAMMSNSFQEIENHADMEWKFSRSKLWMGYFDEGSTLPPPFNMVVTPKAVGYVLRSLKDLFCRCCQRTSLLKMTRESSAAFNHNPSTDAYKPPAVNGNHRRLGRLMSKHVMPEVKYADIMRRLVRRYIHQTKKQRRQDGVNEDDLLEIKQDISSLRYEMREDKSRESQRAEAYLETLRKEVFYAIKSALSSKPEYPVHLHHPVYSDSPDQDSRNLGGADFIPNHTSKVKPPSRQYEDHKMTQRKFKETLVKNLENISHSSYRPGSFTNAKVESYLTHLGDEISSQTSETYPLPNLTSDPYKTLTDVNYCKPTATQYGYEQHSEGDAQPMHTESAFGHRGNRLLSPEDLESIKLEIISSLKSEIRNTARDIATELINPSPATHIVPDLYSDLYQTHLYTQL